MDAATIDKIKGMIYGQLLGDACGLVTEFKLKIEGIKVEFPYKEKIRDWSPNDWTDDSDHMLLVMQSLIANDLKLDTTDFAGRLVEWARHGFPECGDTRGLGLGGLTGMIIGDDRFKSSPELVAYDFWEGSGRLLAPNGSLMRTCALSAIMDPATVKEYSARLSAVTHADPRCIASCVFFNAILHSLIYSTTSTDTIIREAINIARIFITEPKPSSDDTNTTKPPLHRFPKMYHDDRFTSTEEEFSYWIKTAYTGQVADLKLDELGKIGYVFKCLSCGIYALQVIKVAKTNQLTPSFKKFIIKLAEECGDADTNCAVAGAMLGAYLGYSRLPVDWIEALPCRDFAEKIINEYLIKLMSSSTTTPADDDFEII